MQRLPEWGEDPLGKGFDLTSESPISLSHPQHPTRHPRGEEGTKPRCARFRMKPAQIHSHTARTPQPHTHSRRPLLPEPTLGSSHTSTHTSAPIYTQRTPPGAHGDNTHAHSHTRSQMHTREHPPYSLRTPRDTTHSPTATHAHARCTRSLAHTAPHRPRRRHTRSSQTQCMRSHSHTCRGKLLSGSP